MREQREKCVRERERGREKEKEGERETENEFARISAERRHLPTTGEKRKRAAKVQFW